MYARLIRCVIQCKWTNLFQINGQRLQKHKTHSVWISSTPIHLVQNPAATSRAACTIIFMWIAIVARRLAKMSWGKNDTKANAWELTRIISRCTVEVKDEAMIMHGKMGVEEWCYVPLIDCVIYVEGWMLNVVVGLWSPLSIFKEIKRFAERGFVFWRHALAPSAINCPLSPARSRGSRLNRIEPSHSQRQPHRAAADDAKDVIEARSPPSLHPPQAKGALCMNRLLQYQPNIVFRKTLIWIGRH